MSVSSSTIRQGHTVLGGGIRYETAELILLTIPNFELKQKGRILHLFTEIYNAFVQEIQEALDEQQNNFDSLINRNQHENRTLTEPFAFESQIDTDTYPVDLSLKSTDDSNQQTLNQSEINRINESIPILGAPDERDQTDSDHNQQPKTTWTSTRNIPNIKKEAVTPPKSKRRGKSSSSNSTLRQMAMTQLFDPIESPRSRNNSTFIKNEPGTPSEDTTMFMPESLIGLAQPSESLSDIENEQFNSSDQMASMLEDSIFRPPALKRKSIPSPIVTHKKHVDLTDDEEETNMQNEALIETPYEGIESEELLYACPMCRNYWLGLPEELRRKENLTCRHRQRPVARTPEHFWSLGIPNTQTCIQRGYGGVLPPDRPIQRPRRPRRQYHRKLQQQRQQQNESDDDNV